MTREEILGEIKRITDLRQISMWKYRRMRSQAEQELYRVHMADSQLMDLQLQLIDQELERREKND